LSTRTVILIVAILVCVAELRIGVARDEPVRLWVFGALLVGVILAIAWDLRRDDGRSG
jgi:hypothetical protein